MARRPRRTGREGVDRRALRRVAAVLCLLLALYCLIAAAATLPQAVAGEPDARTLTASRSVLPLVLPVFLAFVVVLAAVTRRARTARAARQAAGPVSEAA